MNFRDFNKYVGSIADIELDIRKRAAKVHEDVNQHYDEHPYFYHLNEVAVNVTDFLPMIIERQEDILPLIGILCFNITY